MATSVTAVVILIATVCLSCVSCFPDKKHFAHHALLQQSEELNNLKCEPKAAVVHIAEELEFHDGLADKEYFPKVVSVKRCLESCSFCGIHTLGQPLGRCQPDPEGIVRRPVLAFYNQDNKRKFQEVLVTEHTACTCSS